MPEPGRRLRQKLTILALILFRFSGCRLILGAVVTGHELVQIALHVPDEIAAPLEFRSAACRAPHTKHIGGCADVQCRFLGGEMCGAGQRRQDL
jgi:hypothetical protein